MKPSEQPILYFSLINFLILLMVHQFVPKTTNPCDATCGKSDTGHTDFWDEAINFSRTIKFSNEKREFVPFSITNWILSLKNLKLLWRKLQAVDFKCLIPRSVNQNPLENFFSIIRSHGARNINPTCTHFKAAFNTLILNNFMAAHSIGANCEEDECEAALCSLRYFIHGKLSEDTHVLPLDYATQKVIHLNPVNGRHTLMLHCYMTGYMTKRILKLVGNCKTCRHELLTWMILLMSICLYNVGHITLTPC
jgi:hypothetical protein